MNLNDSGAGSLRDALFLAASGDSITFGAGVAGTISLTSGELANGAAIGWQANQGEQRFGMGHSFGGFYLFRTASNPGTTSGGPALYDFVVNDVGNVGIGTTTPIAGNRLHVAGAALRWQSWKWSARTPFVSSATNRS